MKGTRISFVLIIVMFNVIFTSCKTDTIVVKIQAINMTTSQPRKNLKVEILKVENPLFSMRSFILIHTLTTDNKGFVSFETNKKGCYSIRFYKGTKSTPFYWIDTLEVRDLNEEKKFKLRW